MKFHFSSQNFKFLSLAIMFLGAFLIPFLFINLKLNQENLYFIISSIVFCFVVLIIKFDTKIFWAFFIFLLIGYLFLNKGFAYIGYGKVFIGEIVLGIGIITLLITLLKKNINSNNFFKIIFQPEILTLIIFMVWNAFQTIPYFPIYGLDAARDAVIWVYAIFTLIIIFCIPTSYITNFIYLYQKIFPYWLIWGLIAFFLTNILQFNPIIPLFPTGLFNIRLVDYGMPLAGIAIFLSLRIDLGINKRFSELALWLYWGLWIFNFLISSITARAAFLSAIIGLFPIIFLFPKKIKRLLPLVGIFLILIIGVLSLNFLDKDAILTDGMKREISLQQFTSNILSIFTTVEVSNNNLVGSRDWRLSWWQDIITRVAKPEYFWQGHGYGINLTLEYQRIYIFNTTDNIFRVPHNIFMTFLARSGYPGFFLWCLTLLLIFIKIYRVYILQPRNSVEANILIFYTIYIISYLINASFGILIEGPMGGIWFWGLIGIALRYSYSLESINKSSILISNENP